VGYGRSLIHFLSQEQTPARLSPPQAGQSIPSISLPQPRSSWEQDGLKAILGQILPLISGTGDKPGVKEREGVGEGSSLAIVRKLFLLKVAMLSFMLGIKNGGFSDSCCPAI
jgi:hypothetical protein